MDVFTSKKKNDFASSCSIKFTAVLDDRGRVVIPARIRNRFNLKYNSLVLLEFKEKIDGRSGVEGNMGVCGTSEVGAIPACDPKRSDKNER